MCLLHLSITRSDNILSDIRALCGAHYQTLVNSRTLSTRPRPRTIEIVLEDPRGQGHVLEDSITADQESYRHTVAQKSPEVAVFAGALE